MAPKASRNPGPRKGFASGRFMWLISAGEQTGKETDINMPKRLTTAQQAAYERDGWVAPIDIFSPEEMAEIRVELDAAEAAHGDQLKAAGRNNAHYVLPVLDRFRMTPAFWTRWRM